MSRPTLLVTGASAGIGAAVARMAAARGYDLGLGYRSNREGAEAVQAACEAAGACAVLLAGDLARAEAVDAVFAAFDSAFPQLDAFVNNAGIVTPKARVEEMDAARIEALFATNVTGAFLAARNAVRRMSPRYGGSGGSIVNISSAAARLASPNQYVDYAASKAAIDILTQGLAAEVAGDAIRVNGIRPGLIETDIHAKGGDPDRLARLAPTVPMARAGTADEVAEAVLWLCSDGARYVTGATLDVTGGR